MIIIMMVIVMMIKDMMIMMMVTIIMIINYDDVLVSLNYIYHLSCYLFISMQNLLKEFI